MLNKTKNKSMLKDKLNAIRVILGLQVALEEVVLVDGVTKVSAEKFEPGYDLSVVAEDGSMSPAPEGVHETADMKITVDANGVITAVEPKEAEAETEAEGEGKVEVEVEAAVAPDMDAMLNEKLTPVFNAIEELVKEVVAMKSDIASMKENFDKFSKLPAGTKVPKSVATYSSDLDPVMSRIKAVEAMLNSNKK